MISRRLTKFFTTIPGKFSVDLQSRRSLAANRSELFAANEAKRRQMLSMVAKMDENDLISNHRMIIRSIVNTKFKDLAQENRVEAKRAVSSVFERITKAVKKMDEDSILAILTNEYPPWFTVQCSGLLFDLYEEMTDRIYDQYLSTKSKGKADTKDTILKMLPNMIKMFGFNRALEKIVSEKDTDSTLLEEFAETTDERQALVQSSKSQLMPTAMKSDQQQAESEMAGSIKFNNINQMREQTLEEPTKIVEIGGEIITSGIINNARRISLLEKICFCLTAEFNSFIKSDLVNIIGLLKNAEYYDPRLIDYIGVLIADNVDTTSLEVWLLYLQLVSKATRSYPYHLIYVFRDKFKERLESMTTSQLIRCFSQITKLKLYYFDNFMAKLLDQLFSEQRLASLNLNLAPLLLFIVCKSQMTTSEQILTSLQKAEEYIEKSNESSDNVLIFAAVSRLQSRQTIWNKVVGNASQVLHKANPDHYLTKDILMTVQNMSNDTIDINAANKSGDKESIESIGSLNVKLETTDKSKESGSKTKVDDTLENEKSSSPKTKKPRSKKVQEKEEKEVQGISESKLEEEKRTVKTEEIEDPKKRKSKSRKKASD